MHHLSLRMLRPTTHSIRGPVAALAAAGVALVLGPMVEPGPTGWGPLHALLVGLAMVPAVWTVLSRLDHRGDDVVAQQRKREKLAGVIANQRLESAAQPIIDLIEGRVIGAEMLARFDAAPAAPGPWFDDAADVGLLQELELVAVDVAMAAARHLPASLYISINVSPATLVVAALRTVIERAGINPSRIVLELTEHEAIEDYEPLRRALAPLRALGVRLAVDDAGAGYSSFRHILNLKPDIIKVDRALVCDIHADPGRRALVAAIVMFALEMKASVTAEGVETDDELQVLATLGMDAAQGYLLGRPTLDLAEWAEWGIARPSALNDERTA